MEHSQCNQNLILLILLSLMIKMKVNCARVNLFCLKVMITKEKNICLDLSIHQILKILLLNLIFFPFIAIDKSPLVAHT